jgi:hypothetical protein
MLRPLDTDSPGNSPGSYGSSPPASPSLASPSPSSKSQRFLPISKSLVTLVPFVVNMLVSQAHIHNVVTMFVGFTL